MTIAMKRPEFKEKFVELSEEIFKDSSILPITDSFWDDYFLLPVNTKCLTRLILDQTEESLLNLKKNLSTLFVMCLNKLDLQQQQSNEDLQQQQPSNSNEIVRQRNAITILTVLFRSLFLKKRLNHFNLLSILTKEQIDDAHVLFKRLLKAVESLLLFNNNALRSKTLQLTLILVCGNDNVNENGLNGYFMSSDIFSTLVNIINEENQLNENDFQDIAMLLGILSNYNRYETKNIYLSKIRTLQNLNVFKNIMYMYTKTLHSLTDRYINVNNENETISTSIISFMSKWFGSSKDLSSKKEDSFVSSPTDEKSELFAGLPSAQAALLLPFYDFLNNPNFIKIMVDTCTQTDLKVTDDNEQQKVTIITSLLSFSSYLFQNNRTERANIYSRLLLIILLIITTESDVMDYFAKERSATSIRLCRQRPPLLPSTTSKIQSLFCAVLDTMLLFIRHNIKNKLDLVSYRYAFSVIYKVLCYLNKHNLRLDYHWVELWTTLTSIVQFTASHLDELKNRGECSLYLLSVCSIKPISIQNMFYCSSQFYLRQFDESVIKFISVFNICLTYGETFLSDTKSYDRLYYEVIRSTNFFVSIAEYVNYEKSVEKERGPMTITANEFYNIQLICNHFKPAIDKWQAKKNIKYPTPEQVMSVINENYATLELKRTDKVDSYIMFKEIPNEMGFFRYLLRIAVVDYMNFYTASISVM
ncbi:hypothetical protein BDF20DRAFT_985180 [Mycotypha africana]|uniref:uncharacterized protein n=1 Tax=Mycotypha africana TaxID=64632 RepID=UPI0022FFC9BF|nr:uncharacterized protein BDF20DRAFT_985180 [Mycotypha africana]KAI8987767.1 hypothetical protein BDF20DRAFT_985180 [Mycotypha africana]